MQSLVASPVPYPTRSKARDPRSVARSRRADGSYGALSSNGATIYTVRPVGDGWACQCAGYAARQTCCHVKAVQIAERPCDWCGATAGVAVYSNGFDGGHEIALCNPCLEGK